MNVSSLLQLRIAFIGDAGHPNIQNWCQGLASAGAELHVLSFRGRVPCATRNYGLRIPVALGKLRYFASTPYVRRLVQAINPDVVLGYYVTGYGLLASLTGFHPLIQVAAGSDVLIAPRRHLIKRVVVTYALSNADLVVALAPHVSAAAQQLGVSPTCVFTLPHGIPLESFLSCRRQQQKSWDSPIRLISTRSLKYFYKIDRLIKTIKCARDIGLDLTLTIVGDGPQRHDLVSQARRLGLYDEAVRFLGFIPYSDLPPLLAEHHIYISLAPSDGVSASLLEAMAVGLFPIVTDHPANQHWIKPGENGLLLDDLSPVAVAQAIWKAVSDPSLGQRAWQENMEIVRDRADLYRNSRTYVDRFRQLVNDYFELNSE